MRLRQYPWLIGFILLCGACAVPPERNTTESALPLPAVASLPETRALVGCYYRTGWGELNHRNLPGTGWQSVARQSDRFPLLGFYDDARPEVHIWQAKWAAESGVRFFAYDFYYNAGNPLFMPALEAGPLSPAYPDSLQFCLNWRNGPRSGWQGERSQRREDLEGLADYLSTHCFNRVNYLTFDRRPVLIIDDTLALLEENTRDELRDAVSAMRRAVEDRGFAGLFLVAVCPYDSVDYINLLQDVGYDAFTGGAYLHPLGRAYDESTQTVPYEDMVDRHLRLQIFFSRLAKSRPLRYFPSVAPGWNDAPIRGKEARIELSNSPELFEKMCWNALRYADESLPIILVDSWNAWDTGTSVEPDCERRFTFLDVLRKVYAVDATPLERSVPDQNYINRVSVLTMKERDRPETGRKGIPTPLTLVAATAEATLGLPSQWLFEEDYSDAASGWTVDGHVKSALSPDGLVLNLRGPGRLTSPEFAVPVDHVREINLEFRADVEKGPFSNYRLGRVFWRTTRYANFTEYDSSWFEFSEQGNWQKIRILPANLRSWDEARGFLIQLRIDFGDRPGRKITLRRVEVQ